MRNRRKVIVNHSVGENDFSAARDFCLVLFLSYETKLSPEEVSHTRPPYVLLYLYIIYSITIGHGSGISTLRHERKTHTHIIISDRRSRSHPSSGVHVAGRDLPPAGVGDVVLPVQRVGAVEHVVLDHGLHHPHPQQRREHERRDAGDDLRREDGPVGELVVDGLRRGAELDRHPEQVPYQRQSRPVGLALRPPQQREAGAQQRQEADVGRREVRRGGEALEPGQEGVQVHGREGEGVAPVELEREAQRRVTEGPGPHVGRRGAALKALAPLHLAEDLPLDVEDPPQHDSAEDGEQESEPDVAVVVGVRHGEGRGADGGVVRGHGGGGRGQRALVAHKGGELHGGVQRGGVDEEALEDEDGDPHQVDVGRGREEGLVLHPQELVPEHPLLPRSEQYHPHDHHPREEEGRGVDELEVADAGRVLLRLRGEVADGIAVGGGGPRRPPGRGGDVVRVGVGGGHGGHHRRRRGGHLHAARYVCIFALRRFRGLFRRPL
mmetsp:Transcript_26817/g.57025  ORF Transcript_26817/g.57025 Transcript_26817/m.57025 type:complete len:494 (+) Transcript_26817:291-1772(+)